MKKKTNLIRLILLLVIALVLVIYLAVPAVNSSVNQAMAVLGSANLDAVAAYIRSFGAYAKDKFAYIYNYNGRAFFYIDRANRLYAQYDHVIRFMHGKRSFAGRNL